MRQLLQQHGYELQKDQQIGSGGLGVIWLAKKDGKSFAIKTAKKEDQQADLVQEGQIGLEITHVEEARGAKAAEGAKYLIRYVPSPSPDFLVMEYF